LGAVAQQREPLDPQEAHLTSKEQPPQPPSPTQPVVDRNGRMTKEWFDYFAALRLYTVRTSRRSKELV
jgi:hypothetical protein